MIKYILSIAILLLTLKLSQKYVESLKRELDLSEELVGLVAFLNRRLRLSLAPIPILLRGYSSEILSECGFIDELLRTSNIKSAFLSHVKKEELDPNIYATLCELFEKAGEGDIGLCGAKMSESLKKLEERLDVLKEEFKKQKKIISTLSLGFSLGFIILIL